MAGVITATCASLLWEGERLGLARRPGPALLSATVRPPSPRCMAPSRSSSARPRAPAG